MSKTTLNVHQRIAAVMADVSTVKKEGYNDFHKYAYAKESDYVEAIRPALLKHGLIVIPNLVSETKEGDLTRIVMEFEVINVDNPGDKIKTTIPAQGADKGDKGVYKAITGAKKYFVANTFLIATNDDPEDNEKGYDKQLKSSETKTTRAASFTAPKAAPAANAAAPAPTLPTKKDDVAKPAASTSKGGW